MVHKKYLIKNRGTSLFARYFLCFKLQWIRETLHGFIVLFRPWMMCFVKLAVDGIFFVVNSSSRGETTEKKLCDETSHRHLVLLRGSHSLQENCHQRTRFCARVLSSFQVFPWSLASSTIVLFHVIFGRPLFLFPYDFQSSSAFAMSSPGLRRVWRM